MHNVARRPGKFWRLSSIKCIAIAICYSVPYTLRESVGQLVKEYLLSEIFHEDDGDNQLSDEMSELRTNKKHTY